MPSLNTKLASAPNTQTNYVLKATSSTTIGNSLIQDDGTNVAIGTTPATYKLNVNGTLGVTAAATFSSSVTATQLFASTSSNVVGGINSSDANGGYLTWSTSSTVIADIGTANQIFGSGGAEMFGINARGARNLAFGTNNTERMRIASNGNVNIGNSTTASYGLLGSSNLATNMGITFQNGTGYSKVGGIISVQESGGSHALAFYTRSGGDEGEKMRITSGGILQVGSGGTYYTMIAPNSGTNPSVELLGGSGSNTVAASAFIQLVDRVASGNRQWLMQINGNSEFATWYYNGTSWAVKGYQTTAGTWTNSDERKKTNIEDLEYGLNEVLQLNPKKYNFIHDIEEGKIKQKDMGLIAQEVLPIIPLAVDTYMENENEFYSMNYANLVPVLVKAIQEQQSQIEELKALINK